MAQSVIGDASKPLDACAVTQDTTGRDIVALAQSKFVGQWWTGAVCVTVPGTGAAPVQADLRAGVATVDWLTPPDASSGEAVVVSGSDDGSVDLWTYSHMHLASATASLQHLDGRHAHDDIVSCVSSSASGDRLASSSWDKSIIVWTAGAYLDPAATLAGHTDSIHSVQMRGDTAMLLSASQDRSVRHWDSRADSSAQVFWLKQPAYCATVLQDGNTIVAGDECGSLVFFDDRKHNLQLAQLSDLHKDIVRAVASAPKGSASGLASCGDDGRICIVPSGIPPAEERIQVRTPHEGSAYVRGLAYGKHALYSCGWDGRLATSTGV